MMPRVTVPSVVAVAPPPAAPLLRVLRAARETGGGVPMVCATVWGQLPWEPPHTPPSRHAIRWRQPRAAPLPAPGALVRLAWRFADHGDVQVLRVWEISRVEADVDLLRTVPTTALPGGHPLAGVEGSVTDVFDALWRRLDAPWRIWFNALFWHAPRRLLGYLNAPASLQHHHATRHGLLVHSLDCAYRAWQAARHDPLVDHALLIVAALLHDVAKAEEYAWDASARRWRLSLRGELLGHRLGTLEWLAEARARLPAAQRVPEERALALYHAIEACHAPAWVGLRAPRTPEAHYLASVDALSGQLQLIATHARPHTAQGRWSSALGRRVYCPVAWAGSRAKAVARAA